jgi:hypothetical protein
MMTESLEFVIAEGRRLSYEANGDEQETDAGATYLMTKFGLNVNLFKEAALSERKDQNQLSAVMLAVAWRWSESLLERFSANDHELLQLPLREAYSVIVTQEPEVDTLMNYPISNLNLGTGQSSSGQRIRSGAGTLLLVIDWKLRLRRVRRLWKKRQSNELPPTRSLEAVDWILRRVLNVVEGGGGVV